MTSDGKDKDMDKQEKEEKDIDTQEIMLTQKYNLKYVLLYFNYFKHKWRKMEHIITNRNVIFSGLLKIPAKT